MQLFMLLLIATTTLGTVLPYVQQQQHALESKSPGHQVSPTYSKLEQNNEVCSAGSRHWTGKVRVTHENELFYWYFESQNSPARAPLILFVTGGPCEATTIPVVNGIGPCQLNKHGNKTAYDPWTWTTDYNVLFIDEIAGCGFSTVKNPEHQPVSIDEATLDLKHFLRTFVDDVFPELAGRDLHVVGESFGGLQGVSLVHALSNPQAPGPEVNLTLKSWVATSTLVDIGYWAPSYYDTLCARPIKYLNTSACSNMAAAVPACEREALQCRLNPSQNTCGTMTEACAELVKYWWPPAHNIVKCKYLCSKFRDCRTAPYATSIE